MKIISSRKIRIPMQIKLYKNGKKVHASTFQVKCSLIRSLQVRSWDKAFLCVKYDDDFSNSGFYYSLSDIKQAISIFTEKPLLDYVLADRKGKNE